MSNPNIASTRSIYLKTSVVKIPALGTKTVVKNFKDSNQVLKISSLYISQQGPEQKMPNPLASNETYTFPWARQTASEAGSAGTASTVSHQLKSDAVPPTYDSKGVQTSPGSPVVYDNVVVPGINATAGTPGTGGILDLGSPVYAAGKWTEVQVTFRRSQGNDVTFNLGDGSGTYDLASNLLIKFREVVHAITRDTPVYLGEGDSIEVKVLQGKFSNPTTDGVQVVCSYEKVTNYEDFEVRIGGDGWESGIN